MTSAKRYLDFALRRERKGRPVKQAEDGWNHFALRLPTKRRHTEVRRSVIGS